jgi:arylsulfatase
MDVHGPYNPPDGYAQWSENLSNNKAQNIYDRLTGEGPVPESDVQLASNLYDGEVRYVDEQIGAFLEVLEERNLLNESLVIITSDHGDLFGEYGLYAHPRHVYPELTNIPLMISHPEMESDYVETAVSTLDIRSTIIDFNESSPVSGIGKSLLHYNSLDSNRVTYSSVLGENEESNRRRFAIQTKDNAYWIERNIKINKITKEGKMDFGSNQALTTISNPNSLSGTLTTLREKLMKHSKIRLMNENQTKTSLVHDKEVEERLEALGYK